MTDKLDSQTLTDEFSYIARQTQSRSAQPVECVYILERKNTEGQTVLKQFFDFAAAKVKTAFFKEGKWDRAETLTFDEYGDKDYLRTMYNTFSLYHQTWLRKSSYLPYYRMPPLKID